MFERQYMRLRDAESMIGDAWIALYRGRGWLSSWIQYASGGPYSHAAMLTRVNGHVDVLELREFIGPRRLPLEYHVQRWPGLIDIYRPDVARWPEFNCKAAVRAMRRMTICNYSYAGVAKLALRKVPFVRGAWPIDLVDDVNPADFSAAFCSEGVAAAEQFGGGVDPVPHRPNALVSPNDLSASLLHVYECTVLPELGIA